MSAIPPMPTDTAASGDARTLHVAEIAVARLCHDLSGPLGTVMNALELAAGNADLGAEALQLAGEAARDLTDRLRLCRVLWGRGGPMRTAEVIDLAAGLPGASRMRLQVDNLAEVMMSEQVARLLVSVLMLAADSLRGPGEIVITGHPAERMAVMIGGVRAAWPAGLPGLLGETESAWPDAEPRDMPVRLAVALARAAGATLSLLLSTNAPGGPPPLLIGLRD